MKNKINKIGLIAKLFEEIWHEGMRNIKQYNKTYRNYFTITINILVQIKWL